MTSSSVGTVSLAVRNRHNEFRLEQKFTDCVLLSGSDSYHVHRIILVKQSPYCARIFHEQPIVFSFLFRKIQAVFSERFFISSIPGFLLLGLPCLGITKEEVYQTVTPSMFRHILNSHFISKEFVPLTPADRDHLASVINWDSGTVHLFLVDPCSD
jgi:hypothetical protein